MEKHESITMQTLADLVSGVTERIASGYYPEDLTAMDSEQALALKACLDYIHEWANCLLTEVRLPESIKKACSGTAGGATHCTKMCSGEGVAEPNRAILTQVQRLRGIPEIIIVDC